MVLMVHLQILFFFVSYSLPVQRWYLSGHNEKHVKEGSSIALGTGMRSSLLRYIYIHCLPLSSFTGYPKCS